MPVMMYSIILIMPHRGEMSQLLESDIAVVYPMANQALNLYKNHIL